MPQPQITFARLPQVDPAEILQHMSDPRVVAHMPLATFVWDAEAVARFVASKEAHWQRDGLGHWAFLADGAYVGWGGFQKEGDDWDFGLVLRPESFGLGLPIARKALAFARAEAGIPFVTFLLPPSRRHLGALRRLGAQEVGTVTHDGAVFRQFRLETA